MNAARALRIILLCLAALLSTTSGAYAASAYIFGHTPSGEQNLILNGNIIISAMKSGWVTDTGQANDSKNYFVGGCTYDCGQSAGKINNYFTFDLSNVSVPITSAALSIGSASNSIYIDNAADAVWKLHDISSELLNIGNSRSSGDVDGQNVYKAINDGALYGAWKVDASTAGSQVNVALNSDAIKQINASAGHEFGVGGSLHWRDIIAPVPEPSTWLLMIVGFCMTGYAMRRRSFGIMASQIA